MKNRLYNMMALDVCSSILDNGESKVSYKGKSSIQLPLMSWDIFSMANFNRRMEMERTLDIIKVKTFGKKLNWEGDIESMIDKEQFEAILITDLNQKILWVNKGFTKMTGYSKEEALNKTPRFLQGEKTSVSVKQRIKERLGNDLPFKEVITNYKKNGSSYRCEVKIFPLYKNGNKTHFIALERQVG